MARLPGADPVPLVLDGVDLHPDASALLHATVATLVALVLVNDALALKPETKNRHSFFPKYTYCIAETGYVADKARPFAPDRGYSIMGSCSTGVAILHWLNAY